MKTRMRPSAALFAAIFQLAACGKEGQTPTLPERSINEAVAIIVDLKSGKVVDRGYEWRDNSGFIHVQGRVIEGQALTGDLVGNFKTTIVNSELDPLTGNSKARLLVECAAAWPMQQRTGVFTGEMQQEITDGSRNASTLIAHGEEGFAKLNLELSFKKSDASSGLLVGEGRIVEH